LADLEKIRATVLKTLAGPTA